MSETKAMEPGETESTTGTKWTGLIWFYLVTSESPRRWSQADVRALFSKQVTEEETRDFLPQESQAATTTHTHTRSLSLFPTILQRVSLPRAGISFLTAHAIGVREKSSTFISGGGGVGKLQGKSLQW